jgi:PiT family inorganic phosphate transporter
VLTNLDPASALAIGLLIFSLLLVIAFEATNGFHDAANAVATVIYTKSLTPSKAVVWSGLMNFVGVMIGGISVAYALVELLPAEVLSPPSGPLLLSPCGCRCSSRHCSGTSEHGGLACRTRARIA